MASPPSPLLADSLASFSRATHEAFVAVDADVRKAVALAKIETHEARQERDEARRERDEAIQARHACQLEMQLLKQEVGEYKAALKQADTTIAHQEETIVQARREATQWKDQSQNWQDHFLRVEQDRCKLSSRVEELVSERLLLSNSAPFTPRRTYADILDPAPSTSSTKRASSSSNAHRSRLDSSPDPKTSSDINRPNDTADNKSTSTRKSLPSKSPIRRQHPPAPDVTPASHQTHHQPIIPANRSQTQPRKQPAAQANSHPPITTTRMSVSDIRSEPRRVFIRRVQAVVEMPVKEEDVEEIDLLDPNELSASTSASVSASLSGSGSGSISLYPSTASRNDHDARRSAKTKQAHGRAIVQSDDDEDSGLDDDYDDVEGLHPNEAALNVSDHTDEEDDELMMGAEDNRRELYGIKPIENRGRVVTTKPVGPAGRKRKLAAPTRTQQPKKSRH